MSDTDSESSDAHWAHRARKTMKSIMGNFAVAEDMFLDEVAAIAVAEAAAKAAEPITDGRSTSSSHKGWSKKRELVKSLSKTQDNAPETQVPDNKGKKKGKSKQKGKELTDIGSSVGKGNGKETLGRYRIGSSQLLTAHSVGCVCERWGQVALLGLFTGTRSCSTLQLRCLGLFPGTTFLACSATLAPWCSVPPSP